MKPPQYSRRRRYLLHILLWLLAFLTPFLLRTSNLSPRPAAGLDPFDPGWLNQYACKAVIWVCFFYLNYYFLIPQFVKKNKGWEFFFIQLFLLTLIHMISYKLLTLFIPNYSFNRQNINNLIYYNTIPFVFVLAGCFIIDLYKEKAQADNTLLEEERLLLLQEIKRVRTKVSPQFVHSALDTLRFLLHSKPSQLENGITLATGLMQYMLHEPENGKIPLADEIMHLKKYIAFIEQRYNNSISIDIATDLSENSYEVEHLVLLHYVEDAVLKKRLNAGFSNVSIYLYTKNNLLNFIISNSTAVHANGLSDLAIHETGSGIRKLIINTYQKN